jgi:hypothetical protein
MAVAAPAATRPSDVVEGPLGLVRVSGGSYHAARDVARQAEDVLHRLESLGGRPLAAPSKPLVHVVLPESDWGPASVGAVPATNGLPWRITVAGGFADAVEDFNAQLARLVLSLWTGSSGAPLSRADWLAVGLAENLFPTAKAQNREWVMTLAEEGRLPTLEVILTWNRIPDGPMMEKAVCGQAAGWMLALPGERNPLGAILDQLKRGGRVTGDWLLPILAGASPEDPEALWRAGASKRDVISGGIRPLSPVLFSQFRAALQTPASVLGLGDARDLSRLSPYQLLAVRGAPGARQAALTRAEDVQKLAIGSSPELMEAALRYGSFFKGVAGRTPGFWLRRRLRQADRALRKLEDDAAARTMWMNRYETDADFPDSERSAVFARSVLERYVDEVEARQDAGAGNQPKEGP